MERNSEIGLYNEKKQAKHCIYKIIKLQLVSKRHISSLDALKLLTTHSLTTTLVAVRAISFVIQRLLLRLQRRYCCPKLTNYYNSNYCTFVWNSTFFCTSTYQGWLHLWKKPKNNPRFWIQTPLPEKTPCGCLNEFVVQMCPWLQVLLLHHWPLWPKWMQTGR